MIMKVTSKEQHKQVKRAAFVYNTYVLRGVCDEQPAVGAGRGRQVCRRHEDSARSERNK